MDLRDYQLTCVRNVRAAYDRVGRVLVLSPTGSGKTATAGYISHSAVRHGKSVLWVVNREEILNQTWDTMRQFGFTPQQMSVMKGADKRANPNATMHIGSVQTIMRRAWVPRVDYLILDEAHHFMQRNTWRNIVDRFPSAKLLGLTATPVPGRGTEPMFEEMVEMAKPSELVARGYIVAPRVISVPEEMLPELDGVKTSAGDYVVGDLEKVMNTTKLVGNVVEHWLEHAYDRTTVAFCTTVEHAKSLCEQFKQRGVAAEVYHGKLSSEQRGDAMDRLQVGDTKVLCTVSICLEGWDMPCVRVAIVARPTKSLIVHQQMLGRVMRPFGSDGCVVLDHAGNVLKHGFPDDDREWTLEGPKASEARVKTCPVCYAVVRSTVRICTGVLPSGAPCLHDFSAQAEEEEKRRRVVELEGRLIELKRAQDQALSERRAFWDKLCAEATRNAYKDKWVALQYEKKYDEPAPLSWPRPARPDYKADDSKRRAVLNSLRISQYSNQQPEEWVESKYRTRFGESVADLLAREDRAIAVGSEAGESVAAPGDAPALPPPPPDDDSGDVFSLDV